MFKRTVEIALAALLCVSPLTTQADTIAPPPISVAPTSATPLANQEALTATAWVQSSTEWRIAGLQSYRLAMRQFDVALRDKNWSAALEQTAPFKKLPPAVILDLDETVLDNSAYFARLLRDNGMYTDESWISWTSQSQAPAIPGAVQFVQYAASKGAQVFYISNRLQVEEAATRENLRHLGCPLQGPEDHVLLKGERPEWTSDKSIRRRTVAQNHRVLLLVGDDMNDFVSARSMSLAQRSNLYDKYTNNWGERWILLSNPLYGSWEDAIYNFNFDISREEMLRLKSGVLRYLEPTTPSPITTPTTIP